jgi:ABC-2 type transport system ATP-binding protein
LSSHVLAELERVADHLILISRGRVRLDGPVDELLSRHRLLTGARDLSHDPGWRTVRQTTAGAQTHLLVEAADPTPPGWEARPVSLEELTMAYRREDAGAQHATRLEAIR